MCSGVEKSNEKSSILYFSNCGVFVVVVFVVLFITNYIIWKKKKSTRLCKTLWLCSAVWFENDPKSILSFIWQSVQRRWLMSQINVTWLMSQNLLICIVAYRKSQIMKNIFLLIFILFSFTFFHCTETFWIPDFQNGLRLLDPAILYVQE